MYLKKTKRGILKWIGLFFAVMLLFTLLSRAVYQHGIAVVTTKKPSGGVISHTLSASGKIVENQELAVVTEAGLRISGVLVNEGQQVSQGDVLFTLDEDYLAEAILTQQQEMQKLKLTIQDGWNQNSAAQKRRANAQAQAQESYHSAVSQAETVLERAARDLERAKQALDDFHNGIDNAKAEEAALIAACQEAETACQTASAALEALNAQQEQAIADAIAEAEAGLEAPLSPEEREGIAQSVRQEYAQPLADAQLAVEEASQRKAQADADLEAFRASQSGGGDVSEETLLQNLEKAEEAYEDAIASLNNAETTYGRAIESANLPESTSNSPQISQITYDQMEADLKKLAALQELEGKIRAPVDGVVTQCAIQTGGKTSDNAALLMADLTRGCRFSCLITEDQYPYIGVGDKVTLKSENGSREFKDVPVTTLVPQEGSGNGYRLTVQLSESTLPLGSSVQLRHIQKSESYSCCIPLSALHVDAQGKTYVLVAEPVNTVLGTQTQARAVYVTVLEKNEKTAALQEGTLHNDQQVIVSTDRFIDSGSRVRVE